MLSQALSCVVDPDYRVFQSEPVPQICRYCAKVLIHLGPDKIGEHVVFEGKPRSPPALAIQPDAAKAVSCLRSGFLKIGEMRESVHCPPASSFGCEPAKPT